MNMQDQVVTTQAKVVTAQANREVGPQVQQNASTMISHFKS